MTVQVSEILYYENERYNILALPLNQYPGLPQVIDFGSAISLCWRGYIGTWEVIKDKLFLVRLSGLGIRGEGFTLENLFPGQVKVFAEWFTGEIRLAAEGQEKFTRTGYSSIFQGYLCLDFEKGVMVNKHHAVDKCRSVRNSGELSLVKAQAN